MGWHHMIGESQSRSEAEAVWRRLGVASCLWLVLSTPALGQALEIGGSIGTAARGSEGALVRYPWYPSPGVYANVTWTQRLETTLRVVWVQLGSRQGTSGYFNGCESGRRDCRPAVAFYIVERSKAPWMFVTGSAHYYFRPREVVRPFAGLGVGVSRDSMNVTCEAATASCDNVASEFRLGRRVSILRDSVAIAGIAATFKRNFVGVATVYFHRPGGESSSLFETALTIGYRF
jgi:hypothetical protein